MLYVIEGIGFAYISYHLAKYVGIKQSFAVFTAILILATIADPVIYSGGFLWTASSIEQSLIINVIAFIIGQTGIVILFLKER